VISTTSRTDDTSGSVYGTSDGEWVFPPVEIYNMPPIPPVERDPSRGIRRRLMARPPVPVARRGLPHTLPCRERETGTM